MSGSHDEHQPLLPSTSDHGAGSSSVTNGRDEREARKIERKEWLGEKLESKTFHKFVILLITLDAICVLVDLSYTFLFDDSCGPGGPSEEEEPLFLTVLSLFSLAVTSLFLVEIPLNLYAFGGKFYHPFAHGQEAVHSSLHFLDALVIIGTFIIEVFLRGKERELASLLILVRLWRLVKLVSGVAIGVGETEEENAKRVFVLEASIRASQNDVAARDTRIKQLEEENQKLRDDMARLVLGEPDME
ncbi:hypothetical protein DL93DRAFT_1565135 [Clavulina sp. PMI_390]|nr:hypothetical protein DL93DRAFT_1565135 [Clavulina sp. PMI_390]